MVAGSCHPLFQSTLPHGERHSFLLGLGFAESISIHAPAWGATRSTRFRCSRRAYFNPRSRMGSDHCDVSSPVRVRNFNPRSRMGSDRSACGCLGRGTISIHAPAWGATPHTRTPIPPVRFQSTLPHGERPAKLAAKAVTKEFQSTLPHGERHEPFLHVELRHVISIHAPAWGATLQTQMGGLSEEISIHAPAWGATRTCRCGTCGAVYFNPRSRMGSD